MTQQTVISIQFCAKIEMNSGQQVEIMRTFIIIFSTVLAFSPLMTLAQTTEGTSTSFIRTPDGPRELKFHYEEPVVGEGNVMMLAGRGETSYLDLNDGMKVLFSGIVTSIKDGLIALEAPDQEQTFAVISETRLCRDNVAGVDLAEFEVGSPATVQTSVEEPERAEIIVSGLHAVNPLGSFTDQPAIAECK